MHHPDSPSRGESKFVCAKNNLNSELDRLDKYLGALRDRLCPVLTEERPSAEGLMQSSDRERVSFAVQSLEEAGQRVVAANVLIESLMNRLEI